MSKFRYKKLIFIFAFFFQFTIECNNITIIGAGYVGLVTGAGLADVGHKIHCVDIDPTKINKLNQGQMPIYEPGLTELVKKGLTLKNLSFSCDVGKAIQDTEIVMIAVGTPMGDDGQADLLALKKAVSTIRKNLNSYKVVVIKSTVPIGTNKLVRDLLDEQTASGAVFDVVSNPEFLREGSALRDFFESNPVVIGSDSKNALAIMENLYKPLTERGTALILTNPVTAETIKYAWNAYSATKISYVNELSHLCNATGADIFSVILGISFSEKLLPVHQLKPGPGLGGSCLPKDMSALVKMAESLDVDLSIVKTVIKSSDNQKKKIIDELYSMLDNNVEGKVIAVLGLSFKANTDDIRYSSAIPVFERFLKDGAYIRTFDPQAMQNMKQLFPSVVYCGSAEEAVNSADALLVLTDWEEFKYLDLERIAGLMHQPIVMDARNIWDPMELEKFGFRFKNLGRKNKKLVRYPHYFL